MKTRVLLIVLLGGTLAGGSVQAQFDHLKCYKIKDPVKLKGIVDLNSPQFGLEAGCKIGKAKLFCVPATKTVLQAEDKATGLPIVPLPVTGPNPGDRVCYKVKCPQPFPPDTAIADQFGIRTVTKFKPSIVCAPAYKHAPVCAPPDPPQCLFNDPCSAGVCSTTRGACTFQSDCPLAPNEQCCCNGICI